MMNELVDFMQRETRGMQEEYDRISKRSLEDPGTAGDEGEENWATLLRNWLPPHYTVVTKGRLVNWKGAASPQVDVIVLRPTYPRRLMAENKKIYLTAGVAAAFECKNTLRGARVDGACETAAAIQKLLERKDGHATEELNGPIIYGLLAHSHSWKGAGSDPLGNVERSLIEGDHRHASHPAECIDIVCVSDLAFWSSHKAAIGLVGVPGDEARYNMVQRVHTVFGKSWPGMFEPTSETHARMTPIGSMLSRLLEKLSFYEPGLAAMARYFQLSGIWGGATLTESRDWPTNTLSEKAIHNLAADGHYAKGWPFD
jgi:hypothetical protein